MNTLFGGVERNALLTGKVGAQRVIFPACAICYAFASDAVL